MKVVFGVDHTMHGCTVWCQTPKGRTKRRFRNTCYVAALTKAEQWIYEQKAVWVDEFAMRGKTVEIEIPPEFDRVNERKHITQPADWWAAFEEQAKAEGMSLAAWLGEAAKAQLPKRVAKELTERPPAHRPKRAED